MNLPAGRNPDRLLPLTCRCCGHRADNVGGPDGFIVRERPMSALGPVYTTGPKTLLREIICPACGTLADSQVALGGADTLIDVVEST